MPRNRNHHGGGGGGGSYGSGGGGGGGGGGGRRRDNRSVSSECRLCRDFSFDVGMARGICGMQHNSSHRSTEPSRNALGVDGPASASCVFGGNSDPATSVASSVLVPRLPTAAELKARVLSPPLNASPAPVQPPAAPDSSAPVPATDSAGMKVTVETESTAATGAKPKRVVKRAALGSWNPEFAKRKAAAEAQAIQMQLAR